MSPWSDPSVNSSVPDYTPNCVGREHASPGGPGPAPADRYSQSGSKRNPESIPSASGSPNRTLETGATGSDQAGVVGTPETGERGTTTHGTRRGAGRYYQRRGESTGSCRVGRQRQPRGDRPGPRPRLSEHRIGEGEVGEERCVRPLAGRRSRPALRLVGWRAAMGRAGGEPQGLEASARAQPSRSAGCLPDACLPCRPRQAQSRRAPA